MAGLFNFLQTVNPQDPSGANSPAVQGGLLNSLFDGIHGLVGGLGGAMAGSSPGGQQTMFRNDAYNALKQQTDPGTAALLMGDPQAYQALLGQKIMQAQYGALVPKVGQQNAALLATNPALMGELAKPIPLNVGQAPYTPLNLLGGGQNVAPTPSGLNAQGTPAGTQGNIGQPQAVGAGSIGPANMNGMPSDEDIMTMAHQWVLGDRDSVTKMLGRSYGSTGLVPYIRGEMMRDVAQIMKEGIVDPTTGQRRPMTYADLSANAMKYKGMEGNINDIYKTNGAINTGIGHMAQLVEAYRNLGNANFKPSNYVKNVFGDIFGKPGPVVYSAVNERVAPEIMKIWRATGGTGEEIQRNIDTLSEANSPAQAFGAMAAVAGMMGSKADTNKYQFESIFGPGSGDFMISPSNRAHLKELQGLAQSNGNPAQSANQSQVELAKAWLAANPNDPRAAKVRAKLQQMGVQ